MSAGREFPSFGDKALILRVGTAGLIVVLAKGDFAPHAKRHARPLRPSGPSLGAFTAREDSRRSDLLPLHQRKPPDEGSARRNTSSTLAKSSSDILVEHGRLLPHPLISAFSKRGDTSCRVNSRDNLSEA
jgi:hypothetical protein